MTDEKGLENRYKIWRADGSALPPEAKCFVLRYDKDPVARIALRAYARATPNRKLAADLYQALGEFEPQCTSSCATWCPRCGDCTCVDQDDGDCALHGSQSNHGDDGN